MQNAEVFDAARRGYNELNTSSMSDIISHFEDIESDGMMGHISNVKGILFEQEVVTALNNQGLEAMMFEATNHPISDIAIMSDGDIAAEMQLKATDSVSYINETLAEYPDIPIIATSEVANRIDNVMVIDSGIDNEALTQVVTEKIAAEQMSELGIETVTETSVLLGTEASSEIANEVANDVVSEGLAELVADFAVPISPIGFGIGLLFGLPF
jgi:hypothetical protein